MEHDPDSDLTAVAAALRSKDCDGSRTARVLRETLDQLYDGARTGRYRWDQLYKTEKTHCGTLVEINMQREFGYARWRGVGFQHRWFGSGLQILATDRWVDDSARGP